MCLISHIHSWQLLMVKNYFIVCILNKNVAKKSETLSHKTDLCEHFALNIKFIFNFRTIHRLKQITKNTQRNSKQDLVGTKHTTSSILHTKTQVSEIINGFISE